MSINMLARALGSFPTEFASQITEDTRRMVVLRAIPARLWHDIIHTYVDMLSRHRPIAAVVAVAGMYSTRLTRYPPEDPHVRALSEASTVQEGEDPLEPDWPVPPPPVSRRVLTRAQYAQGLSLERDDDFWNDLANHFHLEEEKHSAPPIVFCTESRLPSF